MEDGSRRLEVTVSLIISGSYCKINKFSLKKMVDFEISFCYDLNPASSFPTT